MWIWIRGVLVGAAMLAAAAVLIDSIASSLERNATQSVVIHKTPEDQTSPEETTPSREGFPGYSRPSRR